MKKGVATKTLVEIVLAAMVIVIGGYFIMGPERTYFMGFLETLRQYFGLSTTSQDTSNNLYLAVQCAHLRCKEGCTDEVKKISWIENDKQVSCADFCNMDEYMGDIGTKKFENLAYQGDPITSMAVFNDKLYIGQKYRKGLFNSNFGSRIIVTEDLENFIDLAYQGDPITSMAIFNDKLYIGQSDGRIIVTEDLENFIDLDYQGDPITSMAVFNDKLYIGQSDGRIIVTEDLENFIDLDYQGDPITSMAIFNDKLYIGQNYVEGFTNPRSRIIVINDEEKIKYLGSQKGLITSMAIFNDKLYIGQSDGHVKVTENLEKAEDLENFIDLGDQGKSIDSMAVFKNKLYIGQSDGHVKVIIKNSKICGENSLNYPVEFENKEDNLVITHSKWDYFDCILPTEGIEVNPGGWAKAQDGVVDFLSIRKDILGSLLVSNENCKVKPKIDTDNSYNKFSLKVNPLYLYSSVQDIIIDTHNYTTYITSEPTYEVIKFIKSDFEHQVVLVSKEIPIKRRIIMKINDLNLESGIEVTKISENEVSYRFKCPGSDGFVSQDSLEKSGSISLCSGTIKLHVIDFGESFVKFGITYVDKQCNSKITKGMCGDQNDGCQPCEVDDGFISCCYLGQDGGEGCEECKPIESPKPDCQTGGYTYDGCIANPYCEPCEYYDGVEKVTKCCVKGRCSYGFMGTGCIPLGCGDKCLGSEDLGCPEKCPCTEYLSNYYCMKPEEEITCEEPHVCREFMSCPYERILSEYSCQGDDVCCGSYWFSITPSNPTLEDDIKITFKDKIGLTNVLLVIDSPIYENDEWGPTRTRRCKRDPEYVKEGDYHTWTWYLKNAIPSPDENNQFELDDRAGEYTVKFYYDVTERDETGCPINGEMLKQTTIMVN